MNILAKEADLKFLNQLYVQACTTTKMIEMELRTSSMSADSLNKLCQPAKETQDRIMAEINKHEQELRKMMAEWKATNEHHREVMNKLQEDTRIQMGNLASTLSDVSKDAEKLLPMTKMLSTQSGRVRKAVDLDTPREKESKKEE
jgi:hypothetical protein